MKSAETMRCDKSTWDSSDSDSDSDSDSSSRAEKHPKMNSEQATAKVKNDKIPIRKERKVTSPASHRKLSSSSSKSQRTRQRVTVDYGVLSDFSSSSTSSSDDDSLFHNSQTLLHKNTQKIVTTDERNLLSSINKTTSCSARDSDSDDTAELVRKLTKKSPEKDVTGYQTNLLSSINKKLVGNENESVSATATGDNSSTTVVENKLCQPLNFPFQQCLSSPKKSVKNKDTTVSSLASNDAEDADDEISACESTNRLPIKRRVQRPKRKMNATTCKIYTDADDAQQERPKESLSQCSREGENDPSGAQDITDQQLCDDSPIQFRLPTQSSSSESSEDESCDDESRGNDDEEEDLNKVNSTQNNHGRRSNEIGASKSIIYTDEPPPDNSAKSTSTGSRQFPFVSCNSYVSSTTVNNNSLHTNKWQSSGGTIATVARQNQLDSNADSTIARQKSRAHQQCQEEEQSQPRYGSNEDFSREYFQDNERITNAIGWTEYRNPLNSEATAVNGRTRQLNTENIAESRQNTYTEEDHQEQYQQTVQSRRTDQELFDEAFVDESSSTVTTYCQSLGSKSRLNPQLKDGSFQHRCGDKRTNEELFGAGFLENNQPPCNRNVTRQENAQQTHQLIDLVDSDNEGENPYNRHHNSQEFSSSQFAGDSTISRTAQGEGRVARSPQFNIAARSFMYNSSRATFSEPPNNIEGVGNRFGKNNDNNQASMNPAPRRVTQDHTNQIINRTTIGVDTPTNVLTSFQARSTSNTPHRQGGYQRQQYSNQHRVSATKISRPWQPRNARATRRVRDATASNVSLAASVVTNNKSSHAVQSHTQATASARNQTPQQCRDGISDIRNFVSRRGLVNETRAELIESVKATRYDIQGHANVTVINPTPISAHRSHQMEEDNDDIIEIHDDEAPPVPTDRSKLGRAKPKTKAKKKRAAPRKVKPRKNRRKSTVSRRSRPISGGSRQRKGRGGSRYGRRGGGSTAGRRVGGGGSGGCDTGVWGTTVGGWSTARPVHHEDPAFQNVGAEISF